MPLEVTELTQELTDLFLSLIDDDLPNEVKKNASDGIRPIAEGLSDIIERYVKGMTVTSTVAVVDTLGNKLIGTAESTDIK